MGEGGGDEGDVRRRGGTGGREAHWEVDVERDEGGGVDGGGE